MVVMENYTICSFLTIFGRNICIGYGLVIGYIWFVYIPPACVCVCIFDVYFLCFDMLTMASA